LPHGAFAQPRQASRDELLFRLCLMSIPRSQPLTTLAVVPAWRFCTLSGTGALSIDTMQQCSFAADCSSLGAAFGSRGGKVSYAEVVP